MGGRLDSAPRYAIRRAADGLWTLEHSGRRLPDALRLPDEALAERLGELVAVGVLSAGDRLAVVDPTEGETIRRVEEFIRFVDGDAAERVSAALRADRWAADEQYV